MIVRMVGTALVALIGFLLFWPTPVDPVAWEAPASAGYTGAYAPNTALASLERISLNGLHGPEDVAAKEEGGGLFLYTSSQEGDILKIDPRTNTVLPFATTGGVPLGMEFDAGGNLIVADAFRGLLSIAEDGTVSVLTDEVDGTP
ncbi:MAG: SMP-30/gluconolactonase/LRE family protein, partial [Pseudomonadota bacterium]